MISKIPTSLLLALGIVLSTWAPIASQGIYLDHVDGLNADGKIDDGSTLTFHMRIVGDETPHTMLNNGFVITPAKVNWNSVSAEFTTDYPLDDWFDLVKVIRVWSDGHGQDTVGTGLVSIFGPGLPVAFDDVLYTITVNEISRADPFWPSPALTLDSSWYPPTNPWMWDVVGRDVAWGGPYSFELVGCIGCDDYTYCTPQPSYFKDLDDILKVHIVFFSDPTQVIMESIRVQGKIPPYEGYPILENDKITTACFIMRFLGASGFRPITGDFETTYTVEFDRTDGTHTVLMGDYAMHIYGGDVTFDGQANLDDLIFAADYFWRGGPVPAMVDHSTEEVYEIAELLDVDRNGEINPLDIRAMMEIVGFQ